MDEFRPPVPHDTLLQTIYNTDPKDTNKRTAIWNNVETDMKQFDAYCARAYSMLQSKLYTTMQKFTQQPPDLNTIEAEADTVAEAAVQLNETIGQLFNFYVKIKEAYDRVGGKESKAIQFANHLIKEQKWCALGFGDIICMLSDIYYSLNELTESEEKVRSDQWTGNSTKKYFVRLEDVTRVKIAICKHLPLLRHGVRQGVILAQDKPGRQYNSYEHLNNQYDNNGEGDENKITSLFFDTPKLHTYHEKILEKDGPTIIRARWYGAETDNKCYLERISWKDSVSDSIIKDKFEIPFDSVGDFITGKTQSKTIVEQLRKKTNVQNPRELVDLIDSVQRRIGKNKLRPLWRVNFGRSTFQFEAEQSVKIAFDASLQFIKEPSNPGKNRWCRDMSKPPAPEDFFYHPFGVLEVKLSGVTQLPKWLDTLLKSDYVIPSHTFNKFFHGTARLYPLRCRVLPPWFAFPSVSQPGFPVKNWYRQAVITDMSGGPSMKRKNSDDGGIDGGDSDFDNSDDDGERSTTSKSKQSTSTPATTVSKPSVSATAPVVTPPNIPPPGQTDKPKQPTSSISDPGFEKKSKFPFIDLIRGKGSRKVNEKGLTPLLQAIRVEPKTYFANERTLLQWIAICILLAGGAITIFTMRNATDAHHTVGVVVLIFALLFAIYSLSVYHYRRNAIVSRNVDGHYDDKWGPTVLVIGLFFYLLASLILQLGVPLAPPAAVGSYSFTRDFRVPLTLTFLSGDISGNLISLRNQIPIRLPQWQYRGNLNGLNTNGTMYYYDSPSNCVLRKNGFEIKELYRDDNSGGNATSFAYVGQDGQLVNRMDATFPKAKYNREEIVRAPYNFDYMREKVYVNLTLSDKELRVQSLSKLVTEFFLWDLVDPISWSSPLQKVNVIPLVQEHRGGLDFTLNGVGSTATFTAYIWYQGNIAVHGELSVSYQVSAGVDLTRSEIRQLKQIFDTLQDPLIFPELSVANATDVASVIYNRARYCSA